MSSAAAIGVFDSGVGGLSVLSHLRSVLPNEKFVYLGDTANVPYGSRSDQEIRRLTERAFITLQSLGVKAVVNACNTSSAFSLSHLREQFTIPIVGLVPALKPAVLETQSGVVGVLATPATLRGSLLADVVAKYAEPAGVRVLYALSTELVPLVENKQATSQRACEILREVLGPIAGAGADQLVLGCTHYPFLATSIHKVWGNRFNLLDSGLAVAHHTKNILATANLLTESTQLGSVEYMVTGNPRETSSVIFSLNGDPNANYTKKVTT